MADLNAQLRAALTEQAKVGGPISYRDLAARLGLKPPQTIHRVALALESLMDEDAAADRPLLAALCIGKTQPGIPAPGFFLKAQALGLFPGDAAGPDAEAFHAHELQRAIAYYGA